MRLETPPESPSVMERARRYMQQCPPAISGQRGYHATFRVASILVHGFALATEEALTVMCEWNLACQPPWAEAELRRKVISAAQAGSKKPHGYLADNQSNETNVEPAPAQKLGRTIFSQPPVLAQPGKPVFVPLLLRRVAALLPQVDEMFMKARSPICPETQTPAPSSSGCIGSENVCSCSIISSRRACTCANAPRRRMTWRA